MKYYKVLDLYISLELPEKINVLALKAQVPSIEEINFIPLEVNLILKFKESTTWSFTQSKNKIEYEIIINGIWNDDSKADIPHVLYGVLRNLWIEKEIYPIHSICINESLLIGHSGTGKTTLALEALNKKLAVFSFDKTLVQINLLENCLEMIGGTTIISIREDLIESTMMHDGCKYVKNGERLVIDYNNYYKTDYKSKK
jgi:hypothetical protein